MTTDSDAPANAMDPAVHPALLAAMVHRRPEPVGDVATVLWDALSPRLVVLIGHEGFNALYDRCLHETSETFPWLDPAEAPPNSSRFEHLRSALESRNLEEGTRATVALFSTFNSVLSDLIGQQLTRKILRSAWGGAFDEAAQEVSPWPTK